ncbi:dienelactone hydrolase family protein [Cellulosimicrobium arenosum]|uniref:Dienelactone hydrolase family protein n=1 Tax=Cellulosimicrobium arenosum TaxID=2708133 RepID=A0A927IZL4_9MICO|nr:dienelactone hydrolase family protein [Cellulosimicrobium arenosum]MBD8078729.1 dienelactone hydrolase family protein [Cellulosimicrobium arenosum]
MAEVLLFHHALGLTYGVQDLAQRLRDAGHVVHVPDLFEGHTFGTLDDGVAYAQELGFDTLLERARGTADALGPALVYAGVSLGVVAAQALAQNRAGAKGAVLLEACVPVSEFGAAWPDAVPVQVHGMDADPFFAGEGDVDAARELVDATPDAELFLYPGDQHLFTDSSRPTYDAQAATLVVERTIRFLDGIR